MATVEEVRVVAVMAVEARVMVVVAMAEVMTEVATAAVAMEDRS